jgi:hypothetical protein
LIWIGVYILIGILTVVLMAYDAFSQTFDFGLSDGWEFFWFQRYVLWLIVIIGCIYFFPKEIYTKITERKYVKEWRTKGSFTRKL